MSHDSSPRGPTTVPSSEPRRIVKKIPPLEPLAEEKRYVRTCQAHVSVFTGFFAWALRQDRFGKRAERRVKLQRRSFGPDGVQAPTQRDRKRAVFTNYFALGTQKDLQPMELGDTPRVHRNRFLFLCCLIGIAVYTLVWISRSAG